MNRLSLSFSNSVAALGALAALALFTAAPARARLAYLSDFSSEAGPQWSRQKTEKSPGGPVMLGRFGNESVRLSLDRLPAHTDVRVSFDVHAIGPWAGNGGGNAPDMFTVTTPGTLPLVQTSFSNTEALQAYPEAAPYSDYPPRKDAARTGALGYPAPGDATYHITRTFPHTDSRLQVDFAAKGLSNGATWGLDNVRVVLYSRVDGNTVSNGDFEAPEVTPGATYRPPDTIFGWMVTDGTASLRNDWEAMSGEQSLLLAGNEPAAVAQDVPTAPNQQYELRFRLARGPGAAPGDAEVEVTWDGREVVTVSPQTSTSPDGKEHRYPLTAPESGRSARLAFRAVSQGGVLLDAVSVSPVAPGDVDLSGTADVADAAAIGRAFLGLEAADPYARLRADVYPFVGTESRQHGDGWLTMGDVRTAAALATDQLGYLPMAEAAVDDLYDHFWIGSPSDGHIMPAWGGRPNTDHPHGSVWEHAQMLRTMMDLYRINQDPALLPRIESWWRWAVQSLDTELTTVGGGTNMNWSDDAGWSTLMYLDIYRLTEAPDALEKAKTLFDNVYERWVDDTYGGGQWYTDEHNQKAVYQVSQILTGLRIYDITGEESYRDRALALYKWVDSALARGRGLYYVDYDRNGPVKKNGPPEPAASDTMLAGNMAMAVTAARIYRATNDRKYLDKAVQTANAILAIETDGGVYMNDRDANVEGFYVADFVSEVLTLPGIGPEHAETLRRTASSIYVNARTPNGMYSGNWSGPAQGPLAAWGKPGRGFRPDQIMISANSVHMIVGAAALGVLKPEPARRF